MAFLRYVRAFAAFTVVNCLASRGKGRPRFRRGGTRGGSRQHTGDGCDPIEGPDRSQSWLQPAFSRLGSGILAGPKTPPERRLQARLPAPLSFPVHSQRFHGNRAPVPVVRRIDAALVVQRERPVPDGVPRIVGFRNRLRRVIQPAVADDEPHAAGGQKTAGG